MTTTFTRFLEEARASFRQLVRHRGPATALVAVLGITMGVSAAALDVLAAYLWRPLPYPAAERLAVVDLPRAPGVSPRDLQGMDWTGLRAAADLVVASDVDRFTVIGGAAPFSVDGRWMTADLFAAFGVMPAAGRLFTADDTRRGARVAVISDRVWQEQYGRSPSIVGRSIAARAILRRGDVETYTIVGVLPPRFWHLDDVGLVLPMAEAGSGTPWFLRLRPGITTDEAAARITSLVRAQVPGVAPDWKARVQPARRAHVEHIRPMLIASAWSVALLGVAAFANLVFLQMARGVGRQREVAVRAALGARPRDILRQMLSEGLVAGACASAVGVLVAWLLLRGGLTAIERVVGRVVPGGAGGPGAQPAALLLTAVGGTLGISLVLAVVLWAAARGTAAHAASSRHVSSTPASSDTPGRLTIRQLIMGAQVAVAFCLLVTAALMGRTAWHLGRIDPGFTPAGVLSANVTLHEGDGRSLAARQQFFEGLTERLRRMPDVAHAGVTGWLPFRVGPTFAVEPEDAEYAAASGSIQGVTPDFFPALQMRLLAGRFITPEDRPGRERAAVVSASLAKAIWSAEPAVGKAFRIRFSRGRTGPPAFGPYRVVGVVADSLRSLVEPTPPQVYVAFAQEPLASNAFLQVKTTRPPLEMAPAVARALAEMDPTVPLASVTTLDALVESEGIRPRLLARLLAGLALLSLTMTIVGLHAVSAWIAQQRQREAALRLALGAERRAVALLLARRGSLAVAGGLVAGWLAARPLTFLLAAELHGVGPGDVGVRVLAAVLLGAMAAFAIWRPAWRASTRDLTALLRTE